MLTLNLLNLLQLACNDAKEQDEEAHTLCGQLEVPDEFCGEMPQSIEIWTTKEDESSCDMSAMSDTGGSSSLWDWKEETVLTVDIDEDGRFWSLELRLLSRDRWQHLLWM